MEERKLTKADIDKVRHIEGFPIGKDEDIIALSRPPYYTACPNPFIEDFIRENGTPYDEATDDYHREPFAADVSEGKNDPIYNAHSYHTKVPYKAIMRYILHYTKPGDIVFDGFCGTGMTGVAAQMCGCPDTSFKTQLEQEMGNSNISWGARKVILNDLSPAASFIAYNYNASADASVFEHKAKKILEECERKFGWTYMTQHVDETGVPIKSISGTAIMGRINYTVYSDVYSCPSCSHDFVFYNVAYDSSTCKMRDVLTCPCCGASFKKKECDHVWESYLDRNGEVTRKIKTVPVHINYSLGKKRYTKQPDKFDLELIERIKHIKCDGFIPHMRMPEGSEGQRNDRIGLMYTDQFYTHRNIYLLSGFYEKCRKDSTLLFWFTSCLPKLTIMNRYMPQHGSRALVGPMAGTLYVSPLWVENEVISQFAFQLPKIIKALADRKKYAIVSTQSVLHMPSIPQNSVDYIFTDPPFGRTLQYSELSAFWDAWLRVKENTETEAIVNKSHNKSILDYQKMMTKAFSEYYRVLKPGHWITVEFHNSQNAVWNAISEAILQAGFITAHVQVLDKQKGTILQMTTFSSVQQDLVISAYKPKESFVREFRQRAGDPEMAWEFVRQHLRNVPVFADGNHDGKLDIIAERQDYLLFDRMVAWHIMNGIPVPMDAHTFYEGLRQRFLQRDGMFFLPDQVNEYDEKRAHMELDTQQLAFVVTDEKNAIAWLNYVLRDGPKTYQEIQPMYLQELHQSKQEKMPELLDMLRENFVQDDKGAWYVPDLSNAADLAKIRRKALLKEFYDSCVPGKGKLKVFRMEAIRAGFDECWKARDFKTIVSVGERLPESVLQEDPALLMYYDNACSRV